MVGVVEQAFGYLRRVDEAGRVELVAPKWCTNGHRLGPNRVLVGYIRCGCEKTRTGGHITWSCRVRGCGDILYSDNHDADVMLLEPPPAMLEALWID